MDTDLIVLIVVLVVIGVILLNMILIYLKSNHPREYREFVESLFALLFITSIFENNNSNPNANVVFNYQ